jgi:uncharacterized protein YbjT (DUF2867 family)
MVAPQDIGVLAAQLMMEPDDGKAGKLYHLEGPQLYTPNEVAEAFSKELGISVHVVTIPEMKWTQTFKRFGFSDEAANSYAAMTKATLEDDHTKMTGQIRGQTTIENYVRKMIAQTQQ